MRRAAAYRGVVVAAWVLVALALLMALACGVAVHRLARRPRARREPARVPPSPPGRAARGR
ncbi:hypothetical protein SAMN05660657_01030 [Geodermatophilus amargosae]|uniref:Uncharacterized protein n=1 Tax=Geodermatophilus amargosae TaxID=1296565 RepID=A0A1I6Y9X6_9ACTN|nr:hypothetical protein SAMN05660657_01030 [Geodermatophilus amargosae]